MMAKDKDNKMDMSSDRVDDRSARIDRGFSKRITNASRSDTKGKGHVDWSKVGDEERHINKKK